MMYPLTSGSKAANSTTFGNARYRSCYSQRRRYSCPSHKTGLTAIYRLIFGSVCDYGTLREDIVKGSVVYCWDYSGQDYTIAELGGVGLISSSDLMTDTAFTSLIAESTLSTKDGRTIDKYINSTK